MQPKYNHAANKARRKAEKREAYLKKEAEVRAKEEAARKALQYSSGKSAEAIGRMVDRVSRWGEDRYRIDANKEEFVAFLRSVARISKKVVDEDTIKYLWRMFQLPHRLVDGWEPVGKSARTQLWSLADHLLGKYKMPVFLYESLATDEGALLFAHLARGGSVPEAVKLRMIPAVMTKKMCHLFMQTTGVMTVPQAVRRAQVLASGGDKRLAAAVMDTSLREFRGTMEDFWLTVIQWLCLHPMIEPGKIGPLLDYINHRRADDDQFAMRGRSPLVLLGEMEAWHGQLARAQDRKKLTFDPSGFKPGLWDSSTENNINIWKMDELLSSSALADEGRAMRHCVYSYAHSCAQGTVSIWSLTHWKNEGGFRMLTVEVVNQSRRIVQARGVCNRMMSVQEKIMLYRWATENNLTVGGY